MRDPSGWPRLPKKTDPAKQPPSEVVQIRDEIRAFFKTTTSEGRTIGSAKCGVYAFYDYDLEPIYIGKTVEGLSGRVSRHLTGRRSDAAAKFVLDPFEVLEIEVFPLFWLPSKAKPTAQMKAVTGAAEYALYKRALNASAFKAVLNEGAIKPAPRFKLPQGYRARIIPEELYDDRKHPDIRIARRARTIASLAGLISERFPSKGLRTTLHVQAKRLESLAHRRLEDFADEAVEYEPSDG